MSDDVLFEYLTSTYWRLVDLHYAETLPRRSIACPVCGHQAARGAYELRTSECQFFGGRLERYACPQCDLVFGPLKVSDLSPAQLDVEYRALYRRYSESDSTAAETRAFRALDPGPGAST